MLEPPVPRLAPPGSPCRRRAISPEKKGKKEEEHDDTMVFPGARTPTPRARTRKTPRPVTTISRRGFIPGASDWARTHAPSPSRPRSARHARAHDVLRRARVTTGHQLIARDHPAQLANGLRSPAHTLRPSARTCPCWTYAHARTTRHGPDASNSPGARPYTRPARSTPRRGLLPNILYPGHARAHTPRPYPLERLIRPTLAAPTTRVHTPRSRRACNKSTRPALHVRPSPAHRVHSHTHTRAHTHAHTHDIH